MTTKPTPEQIQKARELLSFEGKSERLSPIALVARLLARAEAAERERDQWREDAKVLKDEVEVRRNAPFGIKGGAYFPYCPERAVWVCDCPQCQWADRIHAACLDTNRSGALTRAGGGE